MRAVHAANHRRHYGPPQSVTMTGNRPPTPVQRFRRDYRRLREREGRGSGGEAELLALPFLCLLYTSDAADECPAV